MTMAATISPGQIKAIHALIHQIGLDDDTYRLMLKERCGVQTCKALSYVRAALLIEELKAKVAPSPQPSPSMGRGGLSPARPVTARQGHTWPQQQAEDRRLKAGGGTISVKQQVYLGRLFEQLGWAPNRCVGLCKRVLGKPWPQDNTDVDRLLRVLRPMTKRYPTGYDRREKNA